jgi:hypothetical protein
VCIQSKRQVMGCHFHTWTLLHNPYTHSKNYFRRSSFAIAAAEEETAAMAAK